MIESAYWKTELFPAADAIEERQQCLRWTEKQAVMLEREVMIAMFCVRSLIERSKVSGRLATKHIKVRAYPLKKGKSVHLLNRADIEGLYEMRHPIETHLTLAFFTNQVIHSYIIFPVKDPAKKKFTHLMVCSDYERNRRLFEVQIEAIVTAIREVAFDYPSKTHYQYDESLRDYRVKKET